MPVAPCPAHYVPSPAVVVALEEEHLAILAGRPRAQADRLRTLSPARGTRLGDAREAAVESWYAAATAALREVTEETGAAPLVALLDREVAWARQLALGHLLEAICREAAGVYADARLRCGWRQR